MKKPKSSGIPSTASPLPFLGAAVWSAVRFLFLLCMAYVIFSPLIYMISLAVRDSRDIYDMSIVWIPKHFTLENFRMVFDELDFGEVMLNSGIIAFFGTLLSVFICSMAAYGFARFKFKGSKPLFFVVILTILIPPQITAMPNYVLFSSFDFFGIISAITGQPTNINMLDNIGTIMILSVLGQGIRSGLIIFIFRQYYKGIPSELEQAAEIDGCGYISTYFRIMLPNAGGPIRISLLFSLVWYWSDFYTLTTYLPNTRIISSVISNVSEALQTVLYMEARDPYNIVTIEQAACLISLLPILIIFLFAQKGFARSIETTGLVG